MWRRRTIIIKTHKCDRCQELIQYAHRCYVNTTFRGYKGLTNTEIICGECYDKIRRKT